MSFLCLIMTFFTKKYSEVLNPDTGIILFPECLALDLIVLFTLITSMLTIADFLYCAPHKLEKHYNLWE